ncbi:putative arginine deiminase [Varanus komodoensis]|nr:putative arginine deiminase [Varanus komodoensis]
MSERLHAKRRRYPRTPPSSRRFLLLLSLTCLLSTPSSGAQGEDAASKVEFSRQWIPKNKPEHYEVVVPYLLTGEKWKPIKNIYSQLVEGVAAQDLSESNDKGIYIIDLFPRLIAVQMNIKKRFVACCRDLVEYWCFLFMDTAGSLNIKMIKFKL